jgi:ketosteroid isomerase-like protein
MKIIHHNGATTSREEMIVIIKETKNWWPRTRKLSEVEFIGSPNMAVVGILNEVIFSLPNNKTVEERYRETWIFKKTGNQWKPVRCHYSKIMVDKHSEEVN